MKRLILALCAICLMAGLAACTVSNGSVIIGGISTKKTLSGNKSIEKSETALEDIEYTLVVEDIEFTSRIRKDNTPVISISEDTSSKVSLSTDKNILDTISVTLDGATIMVKGDKSYKYDTSEFDLMINAKVKAFQINGGFELDINVPSVTEFNGTVNGAVDGNMSFAQLDKFELTINGAGSIKIKGEAEKSTILVNGAADIDAFDLRTANSELVINGAGTCNVNATDTLDASINGVGEITYDGDPKTVNRSAGIGSITKR